MSSSKVPFGVVLVGVFHLLSAFAYVTSLFTSFPGDFDDEGGIRIALGLVAGIFAILHTAVGIGLFKGKRLALFGAVALGSMNALPAFVGIIASIPLGFFPDVAAWLLPTLLLHGTVIGYLTFSQKVRRAFE